MPPAATVEGVEIYDSGIVMASLLLCNSHILACHAPHVRGEPGAKPFVDDLLLGQGFVRSRAVTHKEAACNHQQPSCVMSL